MLHFIHFNNFWILFYFLLFFSCCQIFNNILIFAQDGVCSSEELSFGPCLPGTPKTCPSTCPLGCHCVENSCCYPASSVQNDFWNRINENSQQNQQQQQPYMGDQQQYGLQNGGQQIGQLNNYLLMLLLLRQQQQMLGGGGSWGCYDQADNCAPFSFLCFYSTNMLNFCPVSCGICPLYNPQFVNQRLLQMLLGGGGGGGFGQQQIGGGGNFGGGFFPFGGLQQGFGGGFQQPQQQQLPYGSNTIGRIQGFLDQTQGLANSANQALGTIGGPGLNLQTIGQALGQRLGFG